MDDLKRSAAYQKSDTLKAFSRRQLSRFMDVFNSVHARVMERGGKEEDAESTAFAIALTTAKRASAALDRKLEPEVHYFAAMAPEQFGGSGDGIRGHKFDFSWVVHEPDVASLAVAGNQFNFEHDRMTTALGEIRGLVLTKDAPLAVRAKVHKDIPFVFVASYYDDVDPELKALDTISAEWAGLSEKDGVETPLPLSFAVTRTPLNGPHLGVERVASVHFDESQLREFVANLPHEKVMNPAQRFKEARGTMPEPKPEDLVAAVKEATASLKTTLASLDGTKEALASLGPNALPIEVLKLADASIKDLSKDAKESKEAVAALQKRFDEHVLGVKKEKAADFAAGLLKEGKIKADATEKWAGLFVKDEVGARELAASLVPNGLGEAGTKAKGETEEMAASLLADIDPRFAKKKEG